MDYIISFVYCSAYAMNATNGGRAKVSIVCTFYYTSKQGELPLYSVEE